MGLLVALDVHTGKELWRVTVDGAQCPPAYYEFAAFSVHVMNSPKAYPHLGYILIVRMTRMLLAYSPDGGKLWGVYVEAEETDEPWVKVLFADGTILLSDGAQYSEEGKLLEPRAVRGDNIMGFTDDNGNLFS